MLTELIVAAEEGEAVNPLLPAWYDIVYSIIPFALVLLLFWKVVLPRMQRTLDERAAKIEGGIAQAESAQAEAKAALEEYNKLSSPRVAPRPRRSASRHASTAEPSWPSSRSRPPRRPPASRRPRSSRSRPSARRLSSRSAPRSARWPSTWPAA